MRKPPAILPPLELLRELFYLDEATGEVRWRVTRKPFYVAGSVAGGLCLGYRIISINNRKYMAHRIVWKMATGLEPPAQLDHRDRDRANNRFSNLREATVSQNIVNSKLRARSGASRSIYRGVVRERNKWAAYIRVNNNKKRLGCFETELEAFAAYERAAIEHYGDFHTPRKLAGLPTQTADSETVAPPETE